MTSERLFIQLSLTHRHLNGDNIIRLNNDMHSQREISELLKLTRFGLLPALHGVSAARVPTRGRTLPQHGTKPVRWFGPENSFHFGSERFWRPARCLSRRLASHLLSHPPPLPRLLPLSLGSRCCSDDATLMHRSDLSLDPAGVVPFPSSTRDHRHLLLPHPPLSKKSQTLNDGDSSSPR
jgi:hypothetical protein